MAKITVTQRRRRRKYLTVSRVYTNILRIVFSKVNQVLEKYIILMILTTFTPLRILLKLFIGSMRFDPSTKQYTKSSMLGIILIQSRIISLFENTNLFRTIVFSRIIVKEAIVKLKSILFRIDLIYCVIPSYSIRMTTALKIMRIRSTWSNIFNIFKTD
jgi:hypothetical protein